MSFFWLRTFLAIATLLSTAIGADPSPEATAEKRLREILGEKSFERDTIFGGRLKFIDTTDRMDVRYEQYRLFGELSSRATREAVRVLAAFLSDERHTYSPGDDYGSNPLCSDAASALDRIQSKHPEITPNAPKTGKLAAWRVWWAANKTNYEQKPK